MLWWKIIAIEFSIKQISLFIKFLLNDTKCCVGNIAFDKNDKDWNGSDFSVESNPPRLFSFFWQNTCDMNMNSLSIDFEQPLRVLYLSEGYDLRISRLQKTSAFTKRVLVFRVTNNWRISWWINFAIVEIRSHKKIKYSSHANYLVFGNFICLW